MKPFRIRVNRLIDFGAIVTLIGVDADANKYVLRRQPGPGRHDQRLDTGS